MAHKISHFVTFTMILLIDCVWYSIQRNIISNDTIENQNVAGKNVDIFMEINDINERKKKNYW